MALAILMLGSLPGLASASPSRAQVNNGGPMSGVGNVSSGLTLLDNQSISFKFGVLQLTLSDTVTLGVMTSWERSYYVTMGASIGQLNLTATLKTNAPFFWAGPSQLPSGSDNLPPFGNWTWSVVHDGITDHGGWSA
ncbi:MAG: hypothetical protein L3K13_04300, partial [Thermoplasmata archaeon]|nr:hypothetical protein [Thermoplasmata archaeon]